VRIGPLPHDAESRRDPRRAAYRRL
jgi:hypothetical protein